ncbi:MAG: TadE/TadG family type IV pilus assembly protein [Anaerolineales bacterium]|nr:MAG: TadE/TadG family type IV pilus assembly protein [Anaerolineales bacterium]
MKLLQKMASLFNGKEPGHNKRRGRKRRGQSLVEFAIAFPVIILLFSGVVEYGFILNYYLSLLDATRESARFYSNLDPFNEDGTDNIDFYSGAAAMVRASLDPQVVNPSYVGRRIILDPATDDVIITVYGATAGSVVNYPVAGPFHMYNNRPPIFTNADIEGRLVSGSPNAGILLVEVHYSYDQVLKLPWLAPFVSDPLILRSYSMMPLSAAEPED